MIAPLAVEVGRPVRFEGYAEDYGVPMLEKCPGRGERSDMAADVRRVILEVSETDATVKTETN